MTSPVLARPLSAYKAMTAPLAVNPTLLPSPMFLAGNSVNLGVAGDGTEGTLHVASVQQNPDGSFSFQGDFKFNGNGYPARIPEADLDVAVVGMITALRSGGPMVSVANIAFSGTADMHCTCEENGAQVKVGYNGSLYQSYTSASTSGTFNSAYENVGVALFFEGLWHNNDPCTVTGTFV
jgi:hypothetical protein